MSNNERYWILEPADFFGCRFIRSDSNYIYYWYQKYQDSAWYEKQTFNYHAYVGIVDTISLAGFMFATAYDPSPSTFFEKTTTIHEYELSGLIFGNITIADGFGYVRYEYRRDEMPPFDIWELTGCVLSDTLYGKTSSVCYAQELPLQIKLFQNYPNPFNPKTNISFQISNSGYVTLKVLDLLGREVAILVHEEIKPGCYEKTFYASGLAS